MASGPALSSGTQQRQKEARGALTTEIEEAVTTFLTTLDNVAVKFGCSEEHVYSLAGVGTFKKLIKRPTTVFGAFCSIKLEEENQGKEKGYMTTMPTFLKEHGAKLSAEFRGLSDDEKAALLSEFLQTKEEKEDTPKNLSNISLSKIVDFRIRHITSACRELNRQFQTECLVVFGHGNVAHTYGSASYASLGAQRWLESVEITHTNPSQLAIQMEGFSISGCTGPSGRINKIQNGQSDSGPARFRHRIIRTECRNLIQEGLERILKIKNHPYSRVQMNYENYERQIVERLGVTLVCWPMPGNVCQPGKLSVDNATILREALARGECTWVKLTNQEAIARKARNSQREANGEVVYGPPRKQRATKKVPTNMEGNGGDNGQIDVEMSEQ